MPTCNINKNKTNIIYNRIIHISKWKCSDLTILEALGSS